MYKMGGQLRECKSRNMLDIAWVLMYADDIALITVSETQMKAAMEVVHHTFEQWGLEVSMKKTKVMSVGHASMASVQLHRGSIEPVDQFKYLGSISAHDISMQPELTHVQRLCKAGQACHKHLVAVHEAVVPLAGKCSSVGYLC